MDNIAIAGHGLSRLPAHGTAGALLIGVVHQRELAHARTHRRRYQAPRLRAVAGSRMPEGQGHRDSDFYHLAEQELRNEDRSNPLRTPDNL